MMSTRRDLNAAAIGVAGATMLRAVRPASGQTQPGPAEIRAIAKEATIYGFPLVDSYRVQHAYFVDRANPEYKAPWNTLRNFGRVFTPDDRAVQTPNSDTPYSFLGMDLRAEPIVLTVPPIEGNRYFSIQMIDAYTFNFDYIGSRTTGNGGGSYMVAGPGWNGPNPPGVAKVFHAETELALAAYRTQLFVPDDIENVRRVQAGYRVQPLSAFLGHAAPTAVAPIDFIAPLTPEQQRMSLDFFRILNFVLRFCPTHPSEVALMDRFARIGIGGGKAFDPSALPAATRTAFEQGMGDAWQELEGARQRMNGGEITSGETFGTRAFLRNNYLYRMLAAVVGIYGNSREEAIYPIYGVDSEGRRLDGAHRYTLRLPPGQPPPVNAFWSLTMYELPSSLLTANPLNRYLLNSPMLPGFVRDADGGITLRLQHASPGAALEPNWLPAPASSFFAVMRLYWPKPEALDGRWQAPALQREG